MLMQPLVSRRSIRKYKNTPVTRGQLKLLLEAAMISPSACNTRPWRFIAITNRELLNKIGDVHNYAKMLYTAQAAIVVVALPDAQKGVRDGLAEGFYPQDCGAATQSILLQAEAIGLSACWCGVMPKEGTMKVVRELLEVPDNEIPFCVIAIGERDENPDPRGKYDEEKVAWVE